MRISAVKRLLRTDLAGAPPGPWLDSLLSHLNTALEGLLRAVEGQLTVQDNLQGFYVDLDVHTRADYTSDGWDTVRFDVPWKARNVQIAQLTQVESNYTPVREPTSVDWIQLNGQVQVRWIAGLADSKRYAVRLLVLA